MSHQVFLVLWSPQHRLTCDQGSTRWHRPHARQLAWLALRTCLATIALPNGSLGGELPRKYAFSECSTIAEALPGLVVVANKPRTAAAYYGNAVIAIRDEGTDGPLCEHGCRLSILTAKERLEQYALVSRKASVERDREYKTFNGTAVYKTILFRLTGDRWFGLDIEYINRDDGSRTYDSLMVGDTPVLPSMTGTDMQTKVAACLERP